MTGRRAVAARNMVAGCWGHLERRLPGIQTHPACP